MKKQRSLSIADKSLHVSNSFLTFALPIIFTIIILSSHEAASVPSGASITVNSTDTVTAVNPDNRSDAGGTITTMVLNTIQQDANWKAYIGNISGTLTLDDSSGATIYRWALDTAEVTGEVYVSRSSSVNWDNLNCSDVANITSEQTVLGMGVASADNINRTFNYTTHGPIYVAGRTISQNTCRSMATFVNDAPQAIASADFPEVLLASGADVVYMSPINQGSQSFNGANNVDFQMIVPDHVTVANTRYYFYVEIGS